MNKLSLILVLALVGSMAGFGMYYNKYSKMMKEYDHNVHALTDTINTYKGKNGQLVADKAILIGDNKLLKDANEKLSKELDNMKVRNPSQVVYVETEVVNEVHDTTYIIDRSSPYQRKDFNFSDSFRRLEGFMELKDDNLGLNITRDQTFVDYTLAIKDGRVYLTSTNPNVQFNEIQGITVPAPKKPKFSIGVGPQLGVGYDLINKQPSIFAGVGVSANFNLLSF